jgi:N-glycosylase/DNA lyase
MLYRMSFDAVATVEVPAPIDTRVSKSVLRDIRRNIQSLHQDAAYLTTHPTLHMRIDGASVPFFVQSLSRPQ